MPPLAFTSVDEAFSSAADVNTPAAGIALKSRNARLAARHQDVHRHAGGDRPQPGQLESGAKVGHARQRQPVALIVGRRTVLAAKVVRIDRAAAKRDLIVVGVVVRLGQRVGGAEPESAGEAPLELDEQRVVVGFARSTRG